MYVTYADRRDLIPDVQKILDDYHSYNHISMEDGRMVDYTVVSNATPGEEGINYIIGG